MIQTTALTKITALKKKLRIIQGGTSASKTFSIMAYLIHVAQSNEGLLISVVSETLPHLKKGAMRDFMAIMKGNRYYQDSRWHKSDSVYTFESGSIVEFFSVDQPGRVHGPRRDVLFINEANNVSYTAYVQLSIRTRKLRILDYNPISEFWVHTEVIPKRPHDFLTLTYKDNESLGAEEVREIESYKDNANWWKVYGLGQLGTKEGQVYDWKQVDEVPEEARRVRRWLDWGFTNDPTAIGSLFEWGHGATGKRRFVVDEEEYRTGLTNGPIADKILGAEEPKTLVVADSAEPKSVEEIRQRGVQVIGSTKGTGSVNFGIDAVQGCEVYVTKRSTNVIKEQRNYLWKLGKDGKPLNVPEDVFNHHMDGIRYAIADLVNAPEPFVAEEDLFFA